MAQTEQDMLIEQLVESMIETLGEDFDYTELTERLNDYRRHPISINKTTANELAELYFIPASLIEQILAHRDAVGGFMSIYELQTVDGMDLNLLPFILLFVTADDASDKRALRHWGFSGGNHDLIARYDRVLQPQDGYLIPDTSGRSRYMGDPNRLLLRYRYQLDRKFGIAFTMKKDPGEQFFAGAQKAGFDFYSGSISWQSNKKWKKIVIGDYTLQFGQGLAMWSGLSFGKGATITSVSRQGVGLRPYRSANEFSFLRGLSATYQFRSLEITPFISFRKLTASSRFLETGQKVFGTINETGYHRTLTEVGNRFKLGQWVYGGNVTYRKKTLVLGMTSYHVHFDHAIQPQSANLQQLFRFSGTDRTYLSLYYQANFRNVYVYGEGAGQPFSGFSYLNGFVLGLSPRFSTVFLHRNYRENYHAFFNQAVAENSIAQNENGFFTGFLFNFNRRWSWSAYADLFSFPWLRFQTAASSRGLDILNQWVYLPNKTNRYTWRYRYRQRERNSTFSNPVNLLSQTFYHQVRFDAQYQISAALRFRNRVEYIHFSQERQSQQGFMSYYDVIYQPHLKWLSGNTRVAWFNTDGFDSRIYAYESDVLYAYSFPMYAQRGIRYYVNLRAKVTRNLNFWLRYDSFIYPGSTAIGSGLARISGNQRTALKIQMRYQF